MSLEIVLLITLWKGAKLEEQTRRYGFENLQQCEQFKKEILELETTLAPGYEIKLNCTYGELRE